MQRKMLCLKGIFGLSPFSNALFFGCNFSLYVPQAVATTIMGVIFDVAKEMTGTLHFSIGMHIGNNTLAWFIETCAPSKTL